MCNLYIRSPEFIQTGHLCRSGGDPAVDSAGIPTTRYGASLAKKEDNILYIVNTSVSKIFLGLTSPDK
jgi:hypothetical protein